MLAHPAAAFLIALAVHVFASWAFPLIDRDEPRFAEASREMLQRGDFIVPHFNGQHRFDKPPLIYWLQAGSFILLGQSEFSARLPSALAAATAAAIICLFARRFASAASDCDPERLGLWAATLFTFSLQVVIHAKAAVADMAMVASVAAGFWAAWEFSRAPRRAALLWLSLLIASLAIGFLAKGPIAWAPLLLLAFSMGAAGRGRAAAAIIPAALALSLGLVALWGIPALRATNGEFFEVGIGKHVIQRGLTAQEGHGSANLGQYLLLLPFYFVTVFISFLPWSSALPLWARSLWRRPAAPIERPLLWTGLAIFLLFSFYKTKLPHYTLPAFPLLAILVARYLIASGRSDCWLRARALAISILVLAVAVAGPFTAPLFPSKQAAAIAAPHIRGDGEFGSIDYREPSLIWYLRGATSAFHRIVKPRDAVAFLASRESRRVLVLSKESASAIPGIDAFPQLGEVHGLNLARGRFVHLLIYGNAPQPPGDPPSDSKAQP